MRLARRALATTVAGLAMAAGSVIVAAPAAATPEDGKGCIGARSIPDSFICVISVTPETVVPTVTVTTVNVTVPELCYFVDCKPASVVGVPVPGVTQNSGVVAVLWYKGQYIPIAVGTVDALSTVYSTINLASATASAALGTATQTATYAAGVANAAANGAIGTATATATYAAGVATTAANGAIGTATQTVTYATGVANAAAATAVGIATTTVNNATTTVNNALTTVDNTVAQAEWKVQQIIAGLPTVDEIRDALSDFLIESGVREIYYAIRYCIDYGCPIE